MMGKGFAFYIHKCYSFPLVFFLFSQTAYPQRNRYAKGLRQHYTATVCLLKRHSVSFGLLV